MEDPRTRVDIRCPRCDRLIASVPDDRDVSDPLICPGCGQSVDTGSAVGDLIERVKDKVADTLSGDDGDPKT